MNVNQKIIDSHIHLWDLATGNPSWLLKPVAEFFLGDYSPLQKNYLIKDYLNDSRHFNIEKAIYLQAGWPRNNLLGEAQWVNQINNGLIGGIVAYANLAFTGADQQLEALAQVPLVKGIRHTLAWHTDNYYCDCEQDDLLNPVWLKQFKLLSQYNLSFDLQIYPEQADDAYNLLKSHPNIPVVIEHLLQPISHDKVALISWEKQLKKLAELSNTFIKISAPTLFTHQFDPAKINFIFETIVHYFSPVRCMIGSNFPVEKLHVSFDQLFSCYFDIAAQYSKNEQHAIFYETAKRFYRI